MKRDQKRKKTKPIIKPVSESRTRRILIAETVARVIYRSPLGRKTNTGTHSDQFNLLQEAKISALDKCKGVSKEGKEHEGANDGGRKRKSSKIKRKRRLAGSPWGKYSQDAKE